MNNLLKKALEDNERLRSRIVPVLADVLQLLTDLENILSYEAPASDLEIGTANLMHNKCVNLESQLRYFLEKR